jgi:hemolysin activation/secretion protein
VRSTLAPGAAVGTSDLIVDVTPGRRVSGSVEADNAGYYYTGEYRVGATVNINNPLGHGDVASLRVLTSGPGLKYARASYQMQFGRATAGVAYTALEYKLRKGFSDLQANGTAEVASVYASYPLIRSRNSNLYALVEYEDRTFQDKVDLFSTVTDKKGRAWMGSFYGNHRDGIAGGGLNTYSLTATSGNIDITGSSGLDPTALQADEAGPRTNGHYGKLGFNFSRLQRITDRLSLYGAIYGQLASRNLDISEKMGLGGMYAVRAYPVGEAYSDQGFVATHEARLLLPKFSERMPGQFHLIGFVDAGLGTVNKNPFNDEKNRRHLLGAGIGLTWSEYNNFVVNTYYARKLGHEEATAAPDKDGRFWIQVVKYF